MRLIVLFQSKKVSGRVFGEVKTINLVGLNVVRRNNCFAGHVLVRRVKNVCNLLISPPFLP